ncbi:MAG: DUF5710 domain-containing protein, partial [Candidatus Adiutrix sp.]|nr:DUF5710 domain-containing protein [Candidatus Adiutrix sp.]
EIVRACRDAERIKKYVLDLELGQSRNTGIAADTALVPDAAKAAPEQVGNPATEKVYLDVPFREKDEAKQLGATWDRDVKKWCARPGADLDKLAKWLPQLEAARETLQQPEGNQPEISQEKVFLQVPYREKDQAKALGAAWDKEAKLWFAPSGVDLTPLAKWIPENEPVPTPALDPVDEFAQELATAGFKLDGLPVMDGQIQRAPLEGGKAGAKDGAYCAHLDGRPNGWFHNHKTGEHVKWIAAGQTLSPEQTAALKTDNERRRYERQKERERGYERVANSITEKICSDSVIQADPEHPYLKAKGVKPFGLYQDRDGNLMVAGLDLAHCQLPGLASPGQEGPPRRPEALSPGLRVQTLQAIAPDGKKHFEPGGKKAGAMHLIGLDQFKKIAFEQERAGKEPLLNQSAPEILMAEGFATGASLHMATGKPVAVAFDAGNLKPVAIQLREKFPQAKIIICADNDHKAKKNIGLEKAQAAAQAVQGQVISPDFTAAEKEKGLTDFNDLHRERGLEALAALVGKALERPAEITQAKGMER